MLPVALPPWPAAQCARSLPLPLAAQDEIATCLEWFKNVPATNKVLLELCNNPVCDYALLVHAIAPDACIVLQWLCQEGARRRMYLGVSINWQRWIAPSAPWSVDLQALPHTNGHIEVVWMAGRRADVCPAGVQECLAWAKKTWQAAVLGPCPRCETRQLKRVCLLSTKLCARCSLATAITG